MNYPELECVEEKETNLSEIIQLITNGNTELRCMCDEIEENEKSHVDLQFSVDVKEGELFHNGKVSFKTKTMKQTQTFFAT